MLGIEKVNRNVVQHVYTRSAHAKPDTNALKGKEETEQRTSSPYLSQLMDGINQKMECPKMCRFKVRELAFLLSISGIAV